MRFRYGHTTHSDWRFSTDLVLAQLEGQKQQAGFCTQANMGIVYLTEAHGEHIHEILAELKAHTQITDWIGTIGQGIVANGVEYFEEPALAIMLLDLPEASVHIFSGLLRPPSRLTKNARGAWVAEHAIVHACPTAPDLPDLVKDMAGKLHGEHLVGGLTSTRKRSWQIANEIVEGGMSGAVFSSEVPILTRITQGCQPLGPAHHITQSEGYLIYSLDGIPALDMLLTDLGAQPGGLIAEHYMRRLSQGLFAGLAEANVDAEIDYQIRNIVALDPDKRSIAIAHHVQNKQQLLFCTRDTQAARNDLIRICLELREILENVEIKGALYYACSTRSGQLFGAPSAEMRIIQDHLGNIPLIGFYANGEIAGTRLYGYSGVLSVFY